MEFNFHLWQLTSSCLTFQCSSTEIELICEETSKDPTLTLLRHYIHMGWPNDHRMLLSQFLGANVKATKSVRAQGVKRSARATSM